MLKHKNEQHKHNLEIPLRKIRQFKKVQVSKKVKDKTRQREVTDAGTRVPLSPHLQCRY